jgi:hypothetical protein
VPIEITVEREYENWPVLFAAFLVIGAPNGVGSLRMVTSTSPVPLTTIAEQDVHTQHLFDANLGAI